MKHIFHVLLVAGLMLTHQNCTDLNTEVYSQITPEKYYKNANQIASAVSAAYTPLYGYWDSHHLQDLTTDQSTVPVRSNGGWNDGGLWPRLMQHDFRDTDFVGNEWNKWFGGVSACNRIIEILTVSLGADAPEIAELRSLRAFYFWMLLDVFGNIPIETKFKDANPTPSQSTPAQVFAFIEKELLETVDKLPVDKGPTYAKMNRWVGYTLLTKLYLNAQRYGAGAKWQQAAEAAGKVIGSNAYVLEPGYFANFRLANENSKENIFVVPYDKINATGFIVRHQALHQSAPATFGFTAQPWGGFSAQTEFYNAFEAKDRRKGMFIVGQQYTQAAEPQWSNESGFFYGNPKESFKLQDCNEDFNNLLNKTGEDCNVLISPAYTLKQGNVYRYKDGARYGKYEYDQNTAFDMPNDFAIFRYADVLLMRAEALWRLNNASVEALLLVNQVRSRAGVDALKALTEKDLYWEIKKELALENQARPTTIRFGRYEDPWFLKTDKNPNKRVFPIPVEQLQANRNLKQNPGY